MKLHQHAISLTEAKQLDGTAEVVSALKQYLTGKKIVAFGKGGGGLWGTDHEQHVYNISKVRSTYHDDDFVSVDIYLDDYSSSGIKLGNSLEHAKLKAKGQTHRGGLIYTDRNFKRHLKELISKSPALSAAIRSIDYSEQGMQGRNYVNLDVTIRKPKKPKV